MRHGKGTPKLGRLSKHREALLANLFSSLVSHSRVKTTLAKAKALRPFAEKVVTLGKKGTLHHRRLAIAKVGQEDIVKKLFTDLAPRFKDRAGGYTRILKLGPRDSDSAPMAIIEWVDFVVEVETPTAEPTEKKADKAETAEKKEKTEGKKKAPKTPKKDAAEKPDKE